MPRRRAHNKDVRCPSAEANSDFPSPARTLSGCLVALFIVAGCGEHRARTPVYPVHGKLTIEGVAAAGATIFFHPATVIDASPLRPLAIVDADGGFSPTTYEHGDGLPAGDYIVTASWPLVVVNELGESNAGDDRLKHRYSDPTRPVARIKVVPGNKEFYAWDLQ